MADDTHTSKPVLVKCPGCTLELPENDYATQRDHMEREHPEIVAARLAEHARWDGWVSD